MMPASTQAPNPIVDNYFKDASVPQADRVQVYKDLHSGAVNATALASAISTKYPGKYGAAPTPDTTNPSTTPQVPGADRLGGLIGKGLAAISPQNLVSSAANGVMMGADALRNAGVSATVTPSSSPDRNSAVQAANMIGNTPDSNATTQQIQPMTIGGEAQQMASNAGNQFMNSIPIIGGIKQNMEDMNSAAQQSPNISPPVKNFMNAGAADMNVLGNLGSNALSGVNTEAGMFMNPQNTANQFIQSQKDLAQGAGNIIGGVANTVGNSIAPFNPLDTRTAEQKFNNGPAQGINQAIQGVGQMSGASMDVFPTAKSAMSAPFKMLGDAVNQGLSTARIDPNSQQGQQIAQSLINALTIGLGIKGAVQGGVLGTDQAGNPVQPSFRGGVQAVADTLTGTPGMVSAGARYLAGTPAYLAKAMTNGTQAVGNAVQGAMNNSEKATALDQVAKLEIKTPALRKIATTASKYGIDVKQEVVNSGLLQDSVDETGRIATKGPGEAVSQIDAQTQATQGIVLRALKQSGDIAAFEDVKSAFQNNLDNMNLGVQQKAAVQANFDNYLKDLSTKVDTNGNIPLADLQTEKINATNGVDYNNPNADTIVKAKANALKAVIEDNATTIDVRAINGEIQKIMAVKDYLGAMDGKVVRGGALGQYAGKLIGGAMGSVAGPVGVWVGQKLGGLAVGNQLANTFNSGGPGIQQSDAMLQAHLAGMEGNPPEAPLKANVNETAPTIQENPVAPPSPETPTSQPRGQNMATNEQTAHDSTAKITEMAKNLPPGYAAAQEYADHLAAQAKIQALSPKDITSVSAFDVTPDMIGIDLKSPEDQLYVLTQMADKANEMGLVPSVKQMQLFMQKVALVNMQLPALEYDASKTVQEHPLAGKAASMTLPQSDVPTVSKAGMDSFTNDLRKDPNWTEYKRTGQGYVAQKKT